MDAGFHWIAESFDTKEVAQELLEIWKINDTNPIVCVV